MLSSKGEKRIHAVLAEYGVPFSEEYEFADLISTSGRHLRFDFAVFDDDGSLDFLIEYQGRQHYESVKHFGGDKAMLTLSRSILILLLSHIGMKTRLPTNIL